MDKENTKQVTTDIVRKIITKWSLYSSCLTNFFIILLKNAGRAGFHLFKLWENIFLFQISCWKQLQSTKVFMSDSDIMKNYMKAICFLIVWQCKRHYPSVDGILFPVLKLRGNIFSGFHMNYCKGK